MNKKYFKNLEFNKIIDLLIKKSMTSLGKEKAISLEPFTDLEKIRLAQKETTEAIQIILNKGSLPLGGLKDIRHLIKRVSLGGILNIQELFCIADFLYICNKILIYYNSVNKKDKFIILDELFNSIDICGKLEKDIRYCILNETEIYDNATSELMDIRKNIKNINIRVKEQLNDILHSQTYKNMLQDFVITIREDRFCVPVKQEYKNSFSGIIHDQSSTGATIFIEPISVVMLNNKIKDLKSKEKIEINKILKNLSLKVCEYKDILYFNLEVISKLDLIFAKGELSISMNAIEPIFNTCGYINIKKGRHPLLPREYVIPTNIYLGKNFNMLLITGPNTGGKTVSLKTIGLFTLMGQAGLHIPACNESELSVFEDIFVDIGDEQSIEQNLSTFSAHMSNIIEILKNVNNNSLVLLDELGSGTDPIEGAALAISILQYLNKKVIRTVVTTHYSELKVYAISSDNIENASCEFDLETLKPTYKLLIGIPGKSNAFDISRRLGLSEDIINNAKSLISKEDIKFENIITDLEISKKTIILEQEKTEKYRKEIEKLKIEFEDQKEKLDKQKEKILLEAKEESRYILQQAKKEADILIKELNKNIKLLNLQNVNKIKQKLNEKLEYISDDIEKIYNNVNKSKVILNTVKKGDRVLINKFNQSGVVMSTPDSNNDIMVKTGIMKIKVNLKDVSLDKNNRDKNVKNHNSNIKLNKSQNISMKIDLRGYMVQEGIEILDKYLDDVYLSGLQQVSVIHGKGTGVLRTAVQNYLKNHPHVKSYRVGTFGEGDTGVTIVQIK